jgi:hypothetical protein
LNTTAAATFTDLFDVGLTDTTFNPQKFTGSGQNINASGGTYVAYLFAHNAGGFGLTGTDNVISCGSYTGAGTVDLGYEPQWVMYKRTESTGPWYMNDTMRGFPVSGNQAFLYANSSDAESSGGGLINLTATGFTHINAGSYIYIAIRRGPMKVPTDGTSVFSPNASSSNTGTAQTTNFPVDLQIMSLTNAVENKYVADRLRGVITTPTNATSLQLRTNSTANELTGGSDFTRYWNNNGFETPSWFGDNYAINGYSGVFWNFRRAPGFFDEVCYTGTGVAGRTVTHNLGVAPQLVITKGRDTTTTFGDWMVLPPTLQNVKLNEDTAQDASSTTAYYFGNNTSVIAPTNTVFTLGSENTVNQSGKNFVAYLFASCPGVSKVGSYTGTGTTQQINCGFTAGARFVLIKRVDSTGAWYVWDSARGIVSGNDPYLLLNSTAAEVTNTDFIDTASTGFEISSTAPAAINASGGTFIFLAIA